MSAATSATIAGVDPNAGDLYVVAADAKSSECGLYRAIRVDHRFQVIHLIKLLEIKLVEKGKNAKRYRRKEQAFAPVAAPLPVFKNDLGRGAVRRMEEPPLADYLKVSAEQLKTPETQLERERQAKFKLWNTILSELIAPDSLDVLLTAGRLHQEITKTAKRFGVDRSTILRRLHRWAACWSVHAASLRQAPVRDQRTPREQQRKRGRKPDLVRVGRVQEGKNASELARASGLVFFKSQRRQQNSGKKNRSISLRKMHRDYDDSRKTITSVQPDGTHVKLPDPRFALTFSEFYNLIKKHESDLERAKLLAGKFNWAKDGRVLLSHARVRDMRPGSTYLIDSTVGDVYLVSALDRTRLIGRPVIYVVVDVFSYCVLSVHVCLTGPSMTQAKVALFKAMTDKTLALRRLGLDVEQLLPCLPHGCVPTRILSDRGEMIGDAIRELAKETSIAHSVTPPFRAELKAIVERFFKVLNDRIVHWLPGATHGRNKERGESDARLDAKLTLAALQRLLWQTVAEWNLTHNMSRGIPLDLASRTAAVPALLYTEGLKWLHGSPNFLGRDEAMRAYLQLTAATASRSGFSVEQQRFTAPWMEGAEFFDMLDGRPVHGVHDPDQAQIFHVLSPTNEFRETYLVSERGEFPVDAMHEDILDYEMVAKLDFQVDVAKRQIAAREIRRAQKNAIDQEVEQSERAQSEDKRTKAGKLRGMKEGRALEVSPRPSPPLALDGAPPDAEQALGPSRSGDDDPLADEGDSYSNLVQWATEKT